MTALTKLLHKPTHDTTGQRANQPSNRPPLALAVDTLVVQDAPSQERAIFRAVTLPAAPLPPTMVRASTAELNAVVDNPQEQFARLKEAVVLGLQSDSISPRVVADLSRMTAAHPGNKELLTLRAVASRLLNDPDGCVADCNAILKLEPGNRFALLHRSSAVCSKYIGGSQTFVLSAEYICAAVAYAEKHFCDQFGLLIRTQVAAPTDKCEEVAGRLMAALKTSPKDMVKATALLALLLERRTFDMALPPDVRIEAIAKQILAVDPTHDLALQIKSWKTGRPHWSELRPFRENAIDRFADSSLFLQDEELLSQLSALELVFVI